jgi:hypothetical protein
VRIFRKRRAGEISTEVNITCFSKLQAEAELPPTAMKESEDRL